MGPVPVHLGKITTYCSKLGIFTFWWGAYFKLYDHTCSCNDRFLYLEPVRADRIHKTHVLDYLAISIKIHVYLIWEISFSDWEFFHQNWEKSILFCIGNRSFYRTQIYRQKNPWHSTNVPCLLTQLKCILVSDQFWSSTSFGHICFKMFVA